MMLIMILAGACTVTGLVVWHRRFVARVEEAVHCASNRFRQRGVQMNFDAYHHRTGATLRIKVEGVAFQVPAYQGTPGMPVYASAPQILVPLPVAQLPPGAVPVQYGYRQ